MANTIQAVIWDLDGVIIDSANEHRLAWQRLAREEGVKMTDEDFWATFGKRNDDILAIVWGPLSPEQAKILANRKEVYFRELIRETAQALPGAMKLMSELHGPLRVETGAHDIDPGVNLPAVQGARGFAFHNGPEDRIGRVVVVTVEHQGQKAQGKIVALLFGVFSLGRRDAQRQRAPEHFASQRRVDLFGDRNQRR